jgi:hypothetical protein
MKKLFNMLQKRASFGRAFEVPDQDFAFKPGTVIHMMLLGP